MKQAIINTIVFFGGIVIFLIITIVSSIFNISFYLLYGGIYAYARNLWLAFDQLANASMGYNRDTNISGMLGYKEINNDLNKFQKIIVWVLNKLDTNHTKDSIEKDEDYEFRAKEK